MQGEISYDLVMEHDMSFVEGTFRLAGARWQVFIVSRGAVTEPKVKHEKWENGITGVFLRFPEAERLDKKIVEWLLGQALDVEKWTEVRGPDSMKLR
jgi:hypothetical protein